MYDQAENQATPAPEASGSSKPFWQSKTMLGILAAFIGLLLRMAVMKGWISSETSALYAEFLQMLADLMGIGGLAFAAYGRAKTTGEGLTLK